MLILTRRVDETIMIGDEVTITVLRVQGGEVRLGIAAPRKIPVHREEVFQNIKREEAAKSQKKARPLGGSSTEVAA